jgi:hypothetical protein
VVESQHQQEEGEEEGGAHTKAIQRVRPNSLFQRSARARVSSPDMRVTTDSWLCQMPRASSCHTSAVMGRSFVELPRQQALDAVDLHSSRTT